ncbi:MAG: DUF1674 domain-containing protein [Sphingomonas sp.]|uniref:DUF1674 domain-containing protein n=1 Tax=unclassified Sphingomonas TaxID=196159 RepID=UPI0024541C4C|nr:MULTISPECIES: DUF1674 domain-containing protein [unclassified Sphingomonas]MBQ1497907.1 DUF1674 domain-containing protein [Sphingomonas sp.]MDH4742477.1 DUF1674 domain-containing protein [Sphingomonas sp. CBMAI 2297]
MAQRPANVKPPAYLTPSPPVPEPAPAKETKDPLGQDPTRYGDWELKGIAVDF